METKKKKKKILDGFNVFLLLKSHRDFKNSSAGKSYSSFPATFLSFMPNELSTCLVNHIEGLIKLRNNLSEK